MAGLLCRENAVSVYKNEEDGVDAHPSGRGYRRPAAKGVDVVPPRPRRAAGRLRHRRAPVPRQRCRHRVAARGRLPRRRDLLRDQRLPHHRPAPGRVPQPRHRHRGRRPGEPEAILGPTGPPAPARPLPAPHHGVAGVVPVHPRRDVQAAGRRGGRPHLRHELVPGVQPAVLLRAGRAALAAEAPVVAGGGGAVLPALAGAARGAARGVPGQAQPGPGHDHHRRPGLHGAHGRALRARHRPVTASTTAPTRGRPVC